MAKQGVNSATVIGNVGQDPKIINNTNGDKVAMISVATGTTWTDEQGNPQQITDWHNIVGFKGAATYIEKAIKKGTKVFVEGEMKRKRWTDQNGQPRTDVQIHAKNIQVMANGRNDNTQQSTGAAHYASQGKSNTPAQQSAPAQQAQPEPVDDFDDDIPF